MDIFFLRPGSELWELTCSHPLKVPSGDCSRFLYAGPGLREMVLSGKCSFARGLPRAEGLRKLGNEKVPRNMRKVPIPEAFREMEGWEREFGLQ